jgi:hypothetical protein
MFAYLIDSACLLVNWCSMGMGKVPGTLVPTGTSDAGAALGPWLMMVNACTTGCACSV